MLPESNPKKSCRGSHHALRLHRNLLQSQAPPLSARLSLPTRVRKTLEQSNKPTKLHNCLSAFSKTDQDALAAKDTLYRCLDLLLEHKRALFEHLSQRWQDLFGVKFEVLLYDLTSTYFESDPPFSEEDKRQFGYSRDKRPDCVQVVIGLIITPEGFPLGYEVLAGNTADKTTLRDFLKKIETQYGKAERIWMMDRGIPTEEVLAEMRAAEPKVFYLVGTPRGRLTKLETQLLERPWEQVREGVEVKVLAQAERRSSASSQSLALSGGGSAHQWIKTDLSLR